MINPAKLLGAILVLLLFADVGLQGQATGKRPAVDALGRHYDRAEKLQQTGKLSDAAQEYRAFLAGALGELAMGYGLARDYRHAAPLFDASLALEPDSAELLLNYARTALVLGDLDRAKTLAANFISKNHGSRTQLAEAHQVLGRTLLKMNQDREARKELETAVDLDPTFPNGYDLAVACLDLDDEKCASQIFAEMEKSFGDTAEIHMAFGRAYGDSDFQPRAVAEFTRAIEEKPRLPGVHYLLAAVQLATGDDEAHVLAAEENLKKEIRISPDDAMSYAALGKIAATRHNYAEAETWLKKAASLDPKNPDTWLYLGQMNFDTHQNAEAENDLRQCIRFTTDVSRNRYQVQKAHFLLGRILMQKGEQQAANAEMKVARDLANKTLSQDRSKLVGLMETSDTPDAATATRDAAGSSPTSSGQADPEALRKVEALRNQLSTAIADSYNNLGAIAATKADYQDAVTYFVDAAKWDPSLDGLDYNWGRAAFAGSLYADALPPLTRYIQAHPGDPGARSVLGISQFMVGRYRDCIDTLRPIMEEKGLAAQVTYVYADAQVMTGDISAGAQQLAALEKEHPEIPDVHRALGEAFEKLGEAQQARDELETAIRLSPKDAASHYDLGRIALAGRDTSAAIANLETAVHLAPNDEKFHQELALAYKAALRPADAQREMNTSNALRARSAASGSRGAVPPEP
jgi:tetratricopeptide (TPR) repeat protein